MEQSTNFDDIYAAFYPKVYRLCKGYFNGNQDIADDVTQEVFIKVWENLPRFRNESNISTWIFRIASNTCLMYLRKQYRKKEVITTEFLETEEESNVNETDDKLSKMYSCINHLEPTKKLIIMLVLESVSYNKIADIIGVTEENLRVMINRIKNKLSKCVENGKI